MDYTNLMNIVEENRENMVNTLREWIQIPSIKSAPEKNAPMGYEINRMLEKALEDCKKLGLSTRNFDGYAMDARMGKIGENPLAILAHLDVVPTGDGWEQDPFGAEIIDGNMYGRGTSDDKGPAVAALYAMHAVLKSGIKLNREIRLILGTDEETNWEGLDYYKQHCDLPKSGFSPDANFPVINTEKGLLRVSVKSQPSKNGVQIIKMYTGERPNVIPGKCKALIKSEDGLFDKINSTAGAMGIKFNIENTNEGIELEVIGTPGHAAMPEEAESATGIMLNLLNKIGIDGPLKALAELVGSETDGSSLGIKVCDKTSGGLTLNIGIIKVDSEQVYALFDIRFPLLANSDRIVKTIEGNLSPYDFVVKQESCTQPHHVSPRSVLVQKLLQAYHEESGLKPEAIAIGGGTYARALEEGVAFGSNFPGEPELAHQAGEHINLESLMKNVRIFAKAIVLLATDEN